MRTIDTTGLRSLGDKERGPWLLDDDRLLRTHRLRVRLTTRERAQDVFDIYAAAFEASSITPEPLELVRVQDGFGVVVKYLRGLSLDKHLAFGTFSPSEAGSAMAGLLRRVHTGTCDVGYDHNARFLRWATSLASLLPHETGSRLVSIVEAIDNPRTLIHGDAHLGNVIVHKDDLFLIDLELGGFGHPMLELAVARSRSVLNLRDEQIRSRLFGASSIDVEEVMGTLWDALWESYLEDVDETTREDLATRVSILSEVEQYGFRLGMSNLDPKDFGEGQRAHLARCERLMAELSPRFERGGLS